MKQVIKGGIVVSIVHTLEVEKNKTKHFAYGKRPIIRCGEDMFFMIALTKLKLCLLLLSKSEFTFTFPCWPAFWLLGDSFLCQLVLSEM